jgi:hypothetical protein
MRVSNYKAKRIVDVETGKASRNFEVGDVVRHFKGGLYIIVTFATNTETNEEMVIYQSLKDKQVWARPYDMFVSEIDRAKYPAVKEDYRLSRVVLEEEE